MATSDAARVRTRRRIGVSRSRDVTYDERSCTSAFCRAPGARPENSDFYNDLSGKRFLGKREVSSIVSIRRMWDKCDVAAARVDPREMKIYGVGLVLFVFRFFPGRI